MTVEKVVLLATELRAPLLKIGITTQQLAYKRDRLDRADLIRILDAYYFLLAIRDVYIYNYNRLLDRLSAEIWKNYDSLGYGIESGIWEVKERIRLEREIKERWRSRPEILTRKPSSGKTQRSTKNRKIRTPREKARKTAN